MVSRMGFAERLYALREDADMKQTDLAKIVSMKSSAISKYEKGLTQPNLDTLVKFAELFHVSTDYLLGVSDIPNPYTTEVITPWETDIIFRFRRLTREGQVRMDERLNAMLDEMNR